MIMEEALRALGSLIQVIRSSHFLLQFEESKDFLGSNTLLEIEDSIKLLNKVTQLKKGSQIIQDITQSESFTKPLTTTVQKLIELFIKALDRVLEEHPNHVKLNGLVKRFMDVIWNVVLPKLEKITLFDGYYTPIHHMLLNDYWGMTEIFCDVVRDNALADLNKDATEIYYRMVTQRDYYQKKYGNYEKCIRFLLDRNLVTFFSPGKKVVVKDLHESSLVELQLDKHANFFWVCKNKRMDVPIKILEQSGLDLEPITQTEQMSMQAVLNEFDRSYLNIKKIGHVIGLKKEVGNYLFSLQGRIFKMSVPFVGNKNAYSLQYLVDFFDHCEDKSDSIRTIRQVFKSARQCFDVEKQYYEVVDYASIPDRYTSGEMTLIPAGWLGHSVGLCLYKNYLLVTNKGEGYRLSGNGLSGTQIYTLNSHFDLPSFIKEVEGLNNNDESEGENFYKVIKEAVNNFKNPNYYFIQKKQKRGNCSFANAKSMMIGMHFLLEREQYPNQDDYTAQMKTWQFYKGCTLQIRVEAYQQLVDEYRNAIAIKQPLIKKTVLEVMGEVILQHHSISKWRGKEMALVMQMIEQVDRADQDTLTAYLIEKIKEMSISDPMDARVLLNEVLELFEQNAKIDLMQPMIHAFSDANVSNHFSFQVVSKHPLIFSQCMENRKNVRPVVQEPVCDDQKEPDMFMDLENPQQSTGSTPRSQTPVVATPRK